MLPINMSTFSLVCVKSCTTNNHVSFFFLIHYLHDFTYELLISFASSSLSVTQGSRDKPFFGCVSKNVCEAAAVLKYLPFLQSLGNITGGPSCCSNSGCNRGPAAATAAAAAAAAITLPEEQNCVIIIISGAPELPLVLLHLLLGLLASILY